MNERSRLGRHIFSWRTQVVEGPKGQDSEYNVPRYKHMSFEALLSVVVNSTGPWRNVNVMSMKDVKSSCFECLILWWRIDEHWLG